MRQLHRFARPLAVANLIANIGIVVTGGAVRLTDSGLGCPTWPRCTEESYVPHGALGIHGAIEFGNRMLTWVLVAVAIASFSALWRSDRARATRPAAIIAVGVPARGVVGGITVLTDLNPWIVSLHLLLSMAMIGVCVLLLDELRGPGREASTELRPLAWLVFGTARVVLYLGTVVTGSGPHSGDLESRRTGPDPQVMSHVHAAAVYALLAFTFGLVPVAQRQGATPGTQRRRRAARPRARPGSARLRAVLHRPARDPGGPPHAGGGADLGDGDVDGADDAGAKGQLNSSGSSATATKSSER
ncbi:COX15/CtaA family protein [Nocardioides sp. B-3]|uniref:COX15/CtaA family protein n=1 Tax=Nocardioides sp. B-3 TaxID=2895565 RepID=UPI00215311A9|nr:COX15/CtaA family protein [Nocardioides sp. B-3]UUZ59230.1 COX15/CtaA family protein [Nocardioides sp. B-3]